MNSALMMMFAVGGRMDPNQLHTLIERMNKQRKALFTKIAELLFAGIMFFLGGLDLKVKGADGILRDASDSAVSAADKLNALLAASAATVKGTLFREFVRPVLIYAAEIISDLMAPDEMMIQLIGGQGAGAGAVGRLPPPPPVNTTAAQWEGRLINTDGNPKVYHVSGGQKHHVINSTVFEARGYKWGDIVKVDSSIVAAIPEGSPEY